MIESRIKSSSDQIKMWKKDIRYHVSEEPFDENMAESRKVGNSKKILIIHMFYL